MTTDIDTGTVSYTPGPWEWEWQPYGAAIHVGGMTIATAHGSAAITKQGLPHAANARLIAAAPELFAAARLALNYLENTEGEFGITFASADALRAAIAKATGAQP